MSARWSQVVGRTGAVGRVAAVVAIVALGAMVRVTPAAARAPDPAGWAPPRTVYIPETGQTIDGLFLDLWRGGGGYWSFGYPITPEYTLENGHVVQYYQYARFEYWPEGDEHANVVVLANIGAELRPIAVPRRAPAAPTSAKAEPAAGQAPAQAPQVEAAVELALIAKAWAPLPADEIRPDSETYRYVAETGHSVQHGFKAFWERTGEASFLGNPLSEEYVLAGTTYQVFARGQLAWEPGVEPSMVPVGEVLAARHGLSTEPVPQGDVPTYSEDLFVPPPAPAVDATGAPPPPPGASQSIVVSLSQQRMWAYEGETVVLGSLVSTGKPGFETPPGTYRIVVKKEIEDMEGLIGGEYYDVPQVPDVMYFTDVGHAFHGAYWHNDFGATRSHGCVNLPLDVASWLYDWTPLGTVVVVYE